ncbi:MAG: hypothetical protein D6744_01305, partial [Planctomycetota bacterium]
LIPASTIDDVPDVSLHDHSRLVAAIAATLYAFHRESDSLDQCSICDRRIPKYRFVTGDLSGIQRHLFRLPTDSRKGLARCYRARSFFLAMLTHVATLKLLRAVRMPVTNRVLDAGGRFVLLVPNTPACRDRLRSEAAQIDAWMLKTYGGDLLLNLDDSVTACGEDFLEDRFSRLFRRLQRHTDASKKRSFRGSLVDSNGWNTHAARLPYVVSTEWLEERAEQDRQLGSALPRARSVAIFEDSPADGLLHQPRNVLGWKLQLFADATRRPAASVDWFTISTPGDESSATPVRAVANHVPIWTRDDLNAIRHGRSAEQQAAPDDEDSRRIGGLITFHDLAELAVDADSAEQDGLAAIACLKADVDRLGMWLSHGCGDRVSFGRTASISRDLDYFFRAFLPSRMEADDLPYRLIYTVFAGGDDLMLIGPWPVMLRFARDLRGWLSQFVGGSTSVTLSAGYALGGGATPVSALADAAGRAVETAKDAGRDRIALFGDVLRWPQFEQALEWGETLDDMAKDSAFPLTPSFLYRLLQYARMAQRVAALRLSDPAGESHPAGRPVGMRDVRQELLWRSHMAYDLQRNIADPVSRKEADSFAEKRVEWLQQTLIHDLQPQHASVLRLAATYALYRNRGE